MKNLFLEYCSNSSVHGVRYFGCRERTSCEKFWWIVVFALSVGCCALVIHKTYRKWDQTPVIVSFAEKSTPVWQIPFPAVTICPETKASGEMLNFTNEFDQYAGMSYEEQLAYNNSDLLLAMIQLCERFFIDRHKPRISTFPNKSTEESYGSLITRMAWIGLYYLEDCYMNNEILPCSLLFSSTMTEEGICTTFNGLATNEMFRTEVIQTDDFYNTATRQSPLWTLESGYSTQANVATYPFRTLGPGLTAGLSLMLTSENFDLDYLCRGPVQGYKILLHSPDDYPQATKKFVRVTMNQETTIAVKPQIITTSAGLRDYSPDRRQCYFNHERYLQFFRVYTQDNCELECLTNYTLHYCGCVKFSMPRTNQMRVCEAFQIYCIMKAEDNLLGMDVVQHQDGGRNFRAECNCLPACTSVQYDVEITQTPFEWMNWARSLKLPIERLTGMQFAQLGIYYKEAQFMTSRRSELYGWTDFLANCGGLLGLFMGVSLLSLVELLYFCSVRPAVLWRNNRKRNRKSGKLNKNDEISTVQLQSLVIKCD